MDAASLKLFYAPKDRLRLTVGEEKSYHTVKPAWAAPLSRPKQYLSLLDGKGNEIVMLKDPATLPPDSWEAVQQELRRRYMTAQVKEIVIGPRGVRRDVLERGHGSGSARVCHAVVAGERAMAVPHASAAH